jgi:hypothetical protein
MAWFRRHRSSSAGFRQSLLPGYDALAGSAELRNGRISESPMYFFTASQSDRSAWIAVKGTAGLQAARAVVALDARRALSRWDERVSHHEVSADQ